MHDGGGFRLAVRLTPNGGRDEIDGFEMDAAGARRLKARVRAVPEDGRANKALIELIAKRFKVAKSAVSIVCGETSRKKILRIEGDPEDLNRIAEAFQSLSPEGESGGRL